MNITVFSHPLCNKHNMDPEHPESPARLHQINEQLIASGLEYVVTFAQGRKANLDELYLAHAQTYIDELQAKDKVLQERANSENNPHIWLDDDTIMMQDSWLAARYAAGCALAAIDEVFTGPTKKAFCATRPPGHHAKYAAAMGFCLINNVAVAAQYARQKYAAKKVVIVDFDVHHGNGTDDIFFHQPEVMLCSSFQHPFYPFCGVDNPPPHYRPVPLVAGTGSTEYRSAVAHWLVDIANFQPDIIIISAGFDAHQEDDLGHIRLVEDDYVWLTKALVELAEEHCSGRIVSVLEGGYALSALGRSVVAHVKSLL